MTRVAVTVRFFLHLARDIVGTLANRLVRQWRRTAAGQEILVVGVDIFPFFEKMTGVGMYEWNILAHLPEVDEGVLVNLYAHSFAAPDEPSPPPLPRHPRVRFRYHHMPRGFLLPIPATIAFLRAVVEPLLLFLDGNDVFFAPNFFVPRRHMAAVKALVPTVHDLAFVRLPETLQQETLDNLNRHLPGALFSATALIAVSAATADDLSGLLRVGARRIHVIHEGVDPLVADDGDGGGDDVVDLPDRYVLFVSTLEPRKNILGIIKGFERAVAAGYPGELVLVGRWGWRTEAAREELAASPARSRIRHLDYLQRAALGRVMCGAEALLFPSWLEGFGLPVVEAMAAGVPVIVSRCSSLPEVAGDAALYVEPDDHDAIGRAVVRLACEPGLRSELAAAGRERAALFRWRDAALATATVLRRAAGLPEHGPDAYRV